MNYRSDIDGLRAIAVLSVVLGHAGLPWLAGGYAGVDVFFVISGFLITRILIDDLASGRFSLGRFYERRARRILPALVVMVLATVPFALTLMLPLQFREYAESVTGVALFLSNVVFFLQSGYFESEAAMKPLLHTWSLAVEEQFYLLHPLLLWAVWRVGRRFLPLVLALIAATSLAAAEAGSRFMPEAAFFLLPFRGWELIAGALATLAVASGRLRANDRLALPGLALILVPMVAYDDSYRFPGLWAAAPVLGTALVLAFGGAGSRTARFLSVRPLVWVGLISYSLYLWHQPLFAFARIGLNAEPSAPVMAGLVGLSLLLGWASWRWVETPFRRRDPWLPGRARLLGASGAALAALAALGIGALAGGIMPLRGAIPGVVTLAQLRSLQDQRYAIIRSGPCHMQSEGNPARFLAAWSCGGHDEPGLKPSGLAIYGDSHAADRAGAIRLAGYDILQLTAAGCPLLPAESDKPYCDANLNAFHDHAAREGIRSVVLANRFKPGEITPEGLQAIVDYWTGRYDRVYLFTPAPMFPRFDSLLQLRPLAELAAMQPDEELRARFLENAATIDLKGVVLLDSHRYFCGTGSRCSPVGQGPLLVDDAHMSPEGMTAFGRRLADDPAGPLGRP